jgi:hypothetical protein
MNLGKSTKLDYLMCLIQRLTSCLSVMRFINDFHYSIEMISLLKPMFASVSILNVFLLHCQVYLDFILVCFMHLAPSNPYSKLVEFHSWNCNLFGHLSWLKFSQTYLKNLRFTNLYEHLVNWLQVFNSETILFSFISNHYWYCYFLSILRFKAVIIHYYQCCSLQRIAAAIMFQVSLKLSVRWHAAGGCIELKMHYTLWLRTF